MDISNRIGLVKGYLDGPSSEDDTYFNLTLALDSLREVYEFLEEQGHGNITLDNFLDILDGIEKQSLCHDCKT
jgi:hypothetical protein